MKLIKSSLRLMSIALLLTTMSCSNEENLEEENPVIDSELTQQNLTTAKNNIYHYVRFNIANGNVLGEFIRKVRTGVSNNGGKVLTTGVAVACPERNCPQRTLILEFPNQQRATSFFNFYKANLTGLAGRAARNLSYSEGTESTSTDNDNVGNNFYVNGTFNFRNQARYFADYIPTAVRTLIKNKGNFISTGFTKCLIGNCTQYNVLIGFNNRRQFNNWINDPEYTPVIPIRLNATQGGGTLLAR